MPGSILSSTFKHQKEFFCADGLTVVSEPAFSRYPRVSIPAPSKTICSNPNEDYRCYTVVMEELGRELLIIWPLKGLQ